MHHLCQRIFWATQNSWMGQVGSLCWIYHSNYRKSAALCAASALWAALNMLQQTMYCKTHTILRHSFSRKCHEHCSTDRLIKFSQNYLWSILTMSIFQIVLQQLIGARKLPIAPGASQRHHTNDTTAREWMNERQVMKQLRSQPEKVQSCWGGVEERDKDIIR